MDKSRAKALFKALRRHPVDFIMTRLDGLYYDCRCFFRPHNVVQANSLPKSWCDRDELMFHTMFQILVDFVELEKPFVSWDDGRKFKKKRHTDKIKMHDWIEKHYNTDEGRESNRNEWMTAEECARIDKQTEHQYRINMEILYLYEWYKDKKYEFDFSYYYNATGENLKLGEHGIEHVKTGKPSLITWEELHDIKQEHKIICSGMLNRILKVRDYLWT